MPSRVAAVLLTSGAFLGGPPIFGAGAAPAPPAQPLGALASVLASNAALKGQQVGIYALRLPEGVVVAAENPDQPLAPASTLKVLTAACALERLGPARRLRTRILADAPPDETGTIRGALYFEGGGDPDLRPEDLWGMLSDLAALGVRRVAGDVVLDDSLFEAPGRPAGWPPPRRSPAPYDSPQGALALAWNGIEVLLTPGRRPGEPARIETAPLDGLAPVAGVVTTAQRTAVDFTLDVRPDRPAVIRVSGVVGRKPGPVGEWVHLGDPTLAFQGALEQLLPAAGVIVEGRLRRGATTPGAVVLLEHESPPLGRLLAPIIKNSLNFGAEMLTRLLAAEDGERPATTAGGVRRIVACANRWEASLDGAHLVDGSGYSRENRLSARALVQTLCAARGNPAWGADFLASLARAGEDGSLRRRLPEFAGRLRGKTGYLDGVAGLTGFLTPRRGGEVVFAILINQGRSAATVSPATVDAVLRALAAESERGP